MLTIGTYLDISHGKGIGLFTKEDIGIGTKYWIRDERFDRIFSPNELSTFSKLTIDYIKFYGFQEKTLSWYLCGDNGKFSNHSFYPNTRNHFDSNGILQFCTVTKNILIGEEIFCDYTEICLTCKKGIIF